MTQNISNSKALIDFKINVRLKLAALWAALMSLYIYADYFQLKTPGKIQETMDLITPVGPVTPKLLVIFSLILIVPALMIFLSVFLKPVLAKWLNIIVAVLWSSMSILIIISGINGLGGWYTFYLLYQFVEVIVFFLIIRQAWKWPREKS